MEVQARRSRKAPASVTVKDVALQAGVSPMTVSRVLNRPGSVDAAMETRVRLAVEALGYVPNRAARDLRGSRTRLVAAVFPSLGGPIFLQLIESLGRHLSARGYQLLVGQSGYLDSREDDLLSDVIARRPDGIVLTGVTHTTMSRRRLEASGIPVVETWDLSLDPIGLLVGFSHAEAGRAVCDFFWRKGRNKLAYVGADDDRSRKRADAFARQAAVRGVVCRPAEYVSAPTSIGDGRRMLARLLDAGEKVDAVFCSSDFVALGVVIEARQRGLQVPSDLMVVGFGDLGVAADVSPSISTIRIDTERIAGVSAAWIADAKSTGDRDDRVVDVGFTLVERETT